MTGAQGRSVGAVILAGGKSERMGVDKAKLPWRDGRTLLERTAACLRHLGEVLISVGAEPFGSRELESCKGRLCGLPVVADRCPGRGPMGGIHSALLACRSDWLLAVSCDMPLFERELADYLISRISDEPGGPGIVLPVTRDGQVHPLCGLYSKGAADILAGLMDAGSYRMTDAARKARFLPVSLTGTPFPDETLANVNTPEEYALLLRGRRHPPVIAVCGAKNSGKTTLLEKLVPALVRRGLRVAVIKHDGHDFTPDMPGTDSFRLKAAGAFGAAVYSANRWMATKDARATVEQMAELFPDADLILLEGGKSSPYPKVEVARNGPPLLSARDPTLLALCADGDFRARGKGIPVFSPDDCEGLAALIVKSVVQ
jgi:molybdopterin-guanine dinucleotide biosynthesis protein MobB